MAHNLEIKNGKASFFSNRIPAWHQLGDVVQGAQTTTEAIRLSRANFRIELEDVHDVTGRKIPNFKSITRQDTRDVFGMVSPGFGVCQPETGFVFLDRMLGEGKAHFETAGVLGRGEKIFILANVGNEADIHGSGDKIKGYVACIVDNTGSGAVRTFFTTIRIVCDNTRIMALAEAKDAGRNGLTHRHSKNIENRMMADANLIDLSNATFDEGVALFEDLATIRVNSEIVAKTVCKMFEVEPEEKLKPAKVEAIERFKMLFEYNDGNAFPQFRGTAYNLLQAGDEYIDHFRPVRMTAGRQGVMTLEQVRAENALVGAGQDFKKKLLETILEETKFAPRVQPARTYAMPASQFAGDNRSLLDLMLN